MFEVRKGRYITTGIKNTIEQDLQIFLWQLIDELVGKDEFEVDYLQIFELTVMSCDDIVYQKIIHRQEVPTYHKEYRLLSTNPVNANLFVIDSEITCTMLLQEEF